MAVCFIALAHRGFLSGESEDATVVAEARKWLRAYNQLDIRAVVWRAAPIPMRSRSAHPAGALIALSRTSRGRRDRAAICFLLPSLGGRTAQQTPAALPVASACDRRSVAAG